MKRLFRLLIVSACILALTLSASAAAVKAEKMTVEMTVDENGTAKAEVSAHLTAEAPVDSLSIALGPNVSGVHIAGQKAKVSRSGGQSTVLLGGESGLSFPMDLHLSYTIRNTVAAGSESQQFSVRLLGAIKDADVDHFSARVQMPGAFEAIPEFSSGYYADGIDNFLTIRVSPEGVITAESMEPMLVGETLDLRLETEPDYFALRNVAGRTLLFDRIAMILLALFGAVYWWRALRSPLPRIEPQTRAPMGVEPGVASMLLTGQTPDLALMALDWAANGYVRAARLRGGRLLLTRLIPMGNERSAYEQEVFSQLFTKKDTVASGTGAWAAAQKRANKTARAYWYGRIFEDKPGIPGLLRLCAILICGFAALSCADKVIPSMTLRPLLLAVSAFAGLIWGAALQYGLGRLPQRRRRQPIVVLAVCLIALIVVLRVSRSGGTLVAALLFSVLTAAALLFGPKRRQNGVDLLSDLLGWRKYLRTITPEYAQQLLTADPQYYYRTLLYAEALGVDRQFCQAFDGLKLDECALFEPGQKPVPRQAAKFRSYLRNVLAYARGELVQKKRRRVAPPKRIRAPQPKPAARIRHNDPRRHSAQTYDPYDEM